MLKIFQARLQEYVNHDLPDIQAGFKKAEEPEIKMPTSVGSTKSKRIPEKKKKKSKSALLTVPKTLCGSQLTVENYLRWENQTN